MAPLFRRIAGNSASLASAAYCAARRSYSSPILVSMPCPALRRKQKIRAAIFRLDCAVLYVLVSYVLTGVVLFNRLHVPDPIAVGIDAIGMPWLSPLVKLGALVGLSSVILVLIMAQSRIFYVMAQDGLLPEFAAKIHPRFHTPYLTTLWIGAAVTALAGILPIGL